MSISAQQLKNVIERAAAAVIDNAEHLTSLDQAIGDGDHGINMKRGFEAVLADLDSITAKPLPDALKAAGMQLVMKVGGAAGPLYGTLFMSLGKALPDGDLSASQVADALQSATDAVKARGKSTAGQKTMLDVLVPLCTAMDGTADDLLDSLPGVAKQAAAATVPMQASKGRASFLGERSIGHMDPGACSTTLITTAVCAALKESL